MRTMRPQRVFLNAHHMNTASAMPMKNSGLISSAERTCGSDDQPPSEIEGRCGACGWMKGLPKKKARPVPNSIMAMPIAMSFTLGSLQIYPWIAPKKQPERPAQNTPNQGEPVR